MQRIYARIPAHFYRVSLHTETDDMTMALVPNQEHATLIARLLTENYHLREGERIVVSPTVMRASGTLDSPQLELAIK